MAPEFRHTGLAAHSATPGFLATMGIRLEATEYGMPVYRGDDGRMFWGGWGSFYSLLDTGVDASALRAYGTGLGKKYGLLECCFSVPFQTARMRHANVVLEIPPNLPEHDRLTLYARNIKKHIRNTVAASSLQYRSAPLAQWYPLYARLTQGHGRKQYPTAWFEELGRRFGDDVVIIGAHEDDALVGALLCIRSGTYVLLFSIVAMPEYRAQRIDSGLYDAAIRYAMAHGISTVDFGLTDARAESLLAYKQGFGGTRRYVASDIFGSPVNTISDFVRRALRALTRFPSRWSG